jgi:hypothetical protein
MRGTTCPAAAAPDRAQNLQFPLGYLVGESMEALIPASQVNAPKHWRDRAAEMRAFSDMMRERQYLVTRHAEAAKISANPTMSATLSNSPVTSTVETTPTTGEPRTPSEAVAAGNRRTISNHMA